MKGKIKMRHELQTAQEITIENNIETTKNIPTWDLLKMKMHITPNPFINDYHISKDHAVYLRYQIRQKQTTAENDYLQSLDRHAYTDIQYYYGMQKAFRIVDEYLSSIINIDDNRPVSIGDDGNRPESQESED